MHSWSGSFRIFLFYLAWHAALLVDLDTQKTVKEAGGVRQHGYCSPVPCSLSGPSLLKSCKTQIASASIAHWPKTRCVFRANSDWSVGSEALGALMLKVHAPHTAIRWTRIDWGDTERSEKTRFPRLCWPASRKRRVHAKVSFRDDYLCTFEYICLPYTYWRLFVFTVMRHRSAEAVPPFISCPSQFPRTTTLPPSTSHDLLRVLKSSTNGTKELSALMSQSSHIAEMSSFSLSRDPLRLPSVSGSTHQVDGMADRLPSATQVVSSAEVETSPIADAAAPLLRTNKPGGGIWM